VVIGGHSLEDGKDVEQITQGRALAIVEYGSRLERIGGVERKDTVRRLTRARELGHLMRLLLSHLTHWSREA